MNWLHYLAEANLYLAAFYLAYQLLLAKETYNQLNRIYLLFSCVAAFVLPVLQIGTLKPVETVTLTSNYATELVYPIQTAAQVVNLSPVVQEHRLTWQNYLVYAYALGCAILMFALLVKLFTLIRMIWTAKREERMGKYKLIYLPDSDVAFSFFNYLFIGSDAVGSKTIIKHELVHITQKHSLDILFVELVKIINWFNPCIYLLQNSLKALHEYIADEQTAAYENDTVGYAAFLVNNAYGAGGSSITHSFFNYSLLKKRIIMLNQKRSGNLARLKYLAAVPICAGLLCVSTLAFSKDYGWIDLDPAKAAVVKTTPEMARPGASFNEKFPPPIITTGGYETLSHYLSKAIHYNPSKTDKGGMVLVDFTITADHKIADATIKKSAGKQLDALALNAFNAYKLTVGDQAGQGLARIYFHNTDYSVFSTEKAELTNHKFDVLIDDNSSVYSTTGKGYDYQMFDSYAKDKNGKYTIHNQSVRIFEKTGEAKEFTPGKNDMKMVREKYGFTWPGVLVKFPPPRPSKLIVVDGKIHYPQPEEVIIADSTTEVPANTRWAIKKWGDQAKYGVKIFSGHTHITKKSKLPKADKIGAASAPADTTQAPVFNELGKELANQVKYPIIARTNNITGRVIARYSVDNNNNLRYVKIVRSPANSLSQEIFDRIKNSQVAKNYPGNWAVVVYFSLGNTDGDDQDPSNSTLPPAEIEAKNFEYNPNNITLAGGNDKILGQVVIRGYVKKPKN